MFIRNTRVASMLSACCKHVVSMLLACCQHAASMLLACCKHVVSMLQACCKHVVSMLSACCKHVVSILPAFVSMLSARCQHVARFCQYCYQNIDSICNQHLPAFFQQISTYLGYECWSIVLYLHYRQERTVGVLVETILIQGFLSTDSHQRRSKEQCNCRFVVLSSFPKN